MFFRTLVEYVNSRSKRVFIQAPNMAFGNRAEEVYFALLKARREGKKVFFLIPWQLPWRLKYRQGNRHLLYLDSPYRLMRYNQLLTFIGSFILMSVFAPLRIWTLLAYKLFSTPINSEYMEPHIGFSQLWKPDRNDRFTWKTVRAMAWNEQFASPMKVSVPETFRKTAEAEKEDMGISLDDWFVCVHAREGGFLNDHSDSDRRNATIANYLKSFATIRDHGGWVVRLGDPSMKPLPKMENVIDYPHTEFKSELMDVFLISQCRFYVGMQSGPLDTALLFQKPIVLVNMYLWVQWFLLRKGDIGTIKHVYSRSKERFLSINEILREPYEIQNWFTLGQDKDDYVFHENTEDEINEAVLEHLRFHENQAEYAHTEQQVEFNRMRILQAHRYFSDKIFKTERDDLLQKYRLGCRVENLEGSLSRAYLVNNWDVSSFSKQRSGQDADGQLQRTGPRISSGVR